MEHQEQRLINQVIDTLAIEKVGHDIIPVMPKVSISTPIGSIEADYGNPLIDGTVILLILGGLYVFKKMLDKRRSDES